MIRKISEDGNGKELGERENRSKPCLFFSRLSEHHNDWPVALYQHIQTRVLLIHYLNLMARRREDMERTKWKVEGKEERVET